MALFALPSLAGLIEAPLLLRAERAPRRWLVGSLLVIALASLAAALSTGVALAACLAVYAPASGVACALAQAELVARSVSAERALTKWTIAGAAGDLGSVALLAVAGSFGLRAAFAVTAAMALVQALLLRNQEVRAPVQDIEEGPRPSVSLRLIAWSFGLALCSLLDEVVIAFGAFHLAERLHAGVHARTLILGSWMVGGIAGLLLCDRLLVARARSLLAITSVLSAVLYLAWLQAGSIATSAALAFLAGAAAAPLYPLAKARAYASGRPAVVNAMSALFSPLEWAVLPAVIGLLASKAGLPIAMAALAIQPVALLVLAISARSHPERGPKGRVEGRSP